MGSLRALWKGQQSLAQTFWVSYFLFCFWVAPIIAGVVLGVCIVLHAKSAGIALATVIYANYFFIATIGVWRSAARYPGFGLWPILARIVVVVMAPFLVFEIIRSVDPNFQIGP